MLNISDHVMESNVDPQSLRSFNRIKEPKHRFSIRFKASLSLILLIGILFIPWTQNIRVPGKVTNLLPNQRTQVVPAAIDARIERWYKREGEFVELGDTIVTISEIKSEFLDPELIARMDEQIQAKSATIQAYEGKTRALENQLVALQQQKRLKIMEAKNKLSMTQMKFISDSAAFMGQNIQFAIADTQYKRAMLLYDQGLRSLSDFESRQAKYQENLAKRTEWESRLEATRAELRVARMLESMVEADFAEKFTYTQSELEETRSKMFQARGDLAKLRNTRASYAQRQRFYAVLAPQDGFITSTIQSGVGEVVKEGEEIVKVLPSNADIGVEIYVRALDMPLVEEGQPVQVVFDGWPALVISGWPGAAIGSYPGKVWAVDRVARPDGSYRVIIEPDFQKQPWPEFIAMGSAVEAIALFKTVPLGYEFWRILNGFPPEFYKNGNGLGMPNGTKTL